MAKWIAKAWAPELAEDSNDKSKVPEPATSASNCGGHIFNILKPMMLVILFSGQKQPLLQLSHTEIAAKLALMQALAESEDNKCPDNGEIEIPLDEEYNGWYHYVPEFNTAKI